MAHSKHVEKPKLPEYVPTSPHSTMVVFNVNPNVMPWSGEFRHWLDNGIKTPLATPSHYPYNLVTHILRVVKTQDNFEITLILDVPLHAEPITMLKYGLIKRYGHEEIIHTIRMRKSDYNLKGVRACVR